MAVEMLSWRLRARGITRACRTFRWPTECRLSPGRLQTAAMGALNQLSTENVEVHELYKAECKTRKSIHNKLIEMCGNIRVFLRVRPALPHEVALSPIPMLSYGTSAMLSQGTARCGSILPSHIISFWLCAML